MPRIGVTGHTRLSARTRALMLDAVTAALGEYVGSEVHGITCLAEGADQAAFRRARRSASNRPRMRSMSARRSGQ